MVAGSERRFRPRDQRPVHVHNERGRLSAALQISTDIREGTAALPGKWWHGESGNLLTSALYAPGGQPAFNDTFVDVSRG